MSIAALMGSMTLESVNLLNDSEDGDDLQLMEVDKELEEATAESNKAEDDLGKLDSSANTLEDIEETLEADLAEGGITPQAAKYLAMTMEAVMGESCVIMTGGQSYATPRNPVMTMESFGSTYTQEEATSMTLEGIGETLGRAYKAIKNAAGRSINASREMFGKLFRGTKGLKKTLDKQRSSLSEYSSDGKADIKIAAYGVRLHIMGQIDAKTVTDGVASVNGVGAKLLKEYLTKSIKMYADLSKGLADIAKGRKEAAALEAETKSNIAELSTELVDLTKRFSKDLPGGFRLVYLSDPGESTKGDKTQKATAGYSLSVLSVEKQDKEARKFDTGQTTPVASKKQLEAILTNVETMIDAIDGRKAEIERMLTEREAAIAAGDELLIAINKDKDGNTEVKSLWKDSKLLTKLIRVANKNAMRSITNYTSYTWRVARAALIYVNTNLKAGGVKTAAVSGGDEQ